MRCEVFFIYMYQSIQNREGWCMYDHSHKIIAYVCMGCYHSITYAYISSVGEVRGNIKQP